MNFGFISKEFGEVVNDSIKRLELNLKSSYSKDILKDIKNQMKSIDPNCITVKQNIRKYEKLGVFEQKVCYAKKELLQENLFGSVVQNLPVAPNPQEQQQQPKPCFDDKAPTNNTKKNSYEKPNNKAVLSNLAEINNDLDALISINKDKKKPNSNLIQ